MVLQWGSKVRHFLSSPSEEGFHWIFHPKLISICTTCSGHKCQIYPTNLHILGGSSGWIMDKLILSLLWPKKCPSIYTGGMDSIHTTLGWQINSIITISASMDLRKYPTPWDMLSQINPRTSIHMCSRWYSPLSKNLVTLPCKFKVHHPQLHQS